MSYNFIAYKLRFKIINVWLSSSIKVQWTVIYVILCMVVRCTPEINECI